MCNELVALKQRHQLDTGLKYSSKLDLTKHLKPFVKALTPCTEDTVIANSAGAKRKLLTSAKQSLETYPIQPEDGQVKMFLKADKAHVFDSEAHPDFGAPRCIQYRNKRYCLRLATFLHPVEKHVYQQLDVSGTPIFAKGRNLMQRGSDLRAKFEHFRNPTIICMDHSKFDAHFGTELLKLEHKFYKNMFRASDREELSQLLAMQMDNKGSTKHGTRYRTRGTRMSGDQNTGLGNSVGNYAMLKAFADHNKWEACFYVDGDDSVMIVEGDVKIDPKFFEQFGMSTKVDMVTKDFQQMEFCQTRAVFDGVSWRMVRNPWRLLARLPWAVQTVTPNCRNKYLRSVGLCEIALGVGLPIAQHIGEKLSQLGTGYMITGNHYMASKEYIRPTAARVIKPSVEARHSYAQAWGISIEEQLQIEAATIQLPDLGDIRTFDEVPYRISN